MGHGHPVSQGHGAAPSFRPAGLPLLLLCREMAHRHPIHVIDTDKRKVQLLKCNPEERTESKAEEGVAARATGNRSYQKSRETGINSARFVEHPL